MFAHWLGVGERTEEPGVDPGPVAVRSLGAAGRNSAFQFLGRLPAAEPVADLARDRALPHNAIEVAASGRDDIPRPQQLGCSLRHPGVDVSPQALPVETV